MQQVAILTAFLVALVAAQPAGAQTLHVISAANVGDDAIGEQVRRNAEAIKAYVDDLAQTTEMKLAYVSIADRYSCEAIDTAVRRLSAGSDDVIMFFHSGHGLSPKKSVGDVAQSDFPVLQCSERQNAGPRLEDISTALRDKGARLTITIADSCNNVSRHPPKARGRSARREPQTPAQQVKAMYRQFRGYILMSSSVPGEYSFYARNGMGLFTEQLLRSLKTPAATTSEPELWTAALGRATAEITALAEGADQTLQHPQHRGELRYLDAPNAVALSPSPAPAAGEPETLRYGDRGTEVERMQKALVGLGYSSVVADGFFGAATLDAVRDFQAKMGIARDGAIGRETRAKLLAPR